MNEMPVCWLRSPTCQETISLESASIAVHVQTSPAPSGAAFANLTFFCLAWLNDQISSHWTALAVSCAPSRHGSGAGLPASISSLETVLIDTSGTRVTERMDDPSHSIERIWTRFSTDSLFMIQKMDRLMSFVKHSVHFDSFSDKPLIYFKKS